MITPPHRSSVETPYGWAIVTASLIFSTVAFGTSYLIIVGLKPIAAEFGWPRWVPSTAYALLMIGSGTGGVVMGWWTDRRGVGRPALVSALTIGCGLAAASRADGMWTLLGLCLLIGLLGNGAAFSPLLTNTTKWFDRRRGLAIAIAASGQSLAGSLWPILFNRAIADVGWRPTWLGYGVAASLVMLPMILVLRRPPPPPTAAPAETRHPAGAGRAGRRAGPRALVTLALLCAAITGCCVAMAMPMVHVVAYCSDLGFDAARGAEMLSLLLFLAFGSRLGFGWLSDRIGGVRTILIGSALQAVALALYAVVTDLTGLYVVSGLFGLVYGGIVPAYAIAVRELFSLDGLGWRMGVVFLFGTLGMALGGFLGGWIFDLTGTYTLAFITGVVFNIGNLLALITLLWRGRTVGPAAVLA